MAKKVLVVGASGNVGHAAVKHFLEKHDGEVIATARRRPAGLDAARFISADLTDAAQCAERFGALEGLTHIVYTALHERPELIAGWQDEAQFQINAQMFRNLMDPLLARSQALRHVVLLQGTKAYGIHVRPMKVPAREDRDEMREQPNFYWLQEDYLKARQAGADWTWTVLRPQIIFGESMGSAMNVIPAIGVYAALMALEGEVLPFPGGPSNILEAVDADLLAHAIRWSGESAGAANQVFNIANGDIFLWDNVWPAIADACGLRPGPNRPLRLAEAMPRRAAQWDAIRKRHDLLSPDLESFVGASFQYADYCFNTGFDKPGPHSIVSTLKLRQAGFHETVDTEAMFRKWFRILRERRLLPALPD